MTNDITEEKGNPHRFKPGNPYAITPEKSREFHLMRKAEKARSKLKGLADVMVKQGGTPLDVDAMTDEELIAAAGDTVRAMTRHMAEQFMESKNVRGLAESYSKLVDALSEDDRTRTPEPPPPPGQISASPEALLEFVGQIEAEIKRRTDAERAINVDAEAWAEAQIQKT